MKRIRWNEVDWALSNAEIARATGAHPGTVSRMRGRRGVGRRRYDWGSVDWRLSNAEIARRLGCSERTVKNGRYRHGRPSGLRPLGRPGVRWQEVDWTLSNAEIARRLGRTYPHVSAMRGKYAWGTGTVYRYGSAGSDGSDEGTEVAA